MPEYFLILVALFVFTVFLHQAFKIKLFKSKKHLFFTYLTILVVGIAWDNFAIWRGHWSFGQQFLLGPKIGFMPLEEYGFALIPTYFVFVIYRLFEPKPKK